MNTELTRGETSPPALHPSEERDSLPAFSQDLLCSLHSPRQTRNQLMLNNVGKVLSGSALMPNHRIRGLKQSGSSSLPPLRRAGWKGIINSTSYCSQHFRRLLPAREHKGLNLLPKHLQLSDSSERRVKKSNFPGKRGKRFECTDRIYLFFN